MKSRAHATFAMAIAALAVGISLWLVEPVQTAAQKGEKPVDKTGLDILCSGKGDAYSAPSKSGLSTCIFSDGDVMTCDSNTNQCTSKRDATADRGINADAMTLRMLHQLNQKVDRLTAQVQALSAARK